VTEGESEEAKEIDVEIISMKLIKRTFVDAKGNSVTERTAPTCQQPFRLEELKLAGLCCVYG
jgi:hypothetical protein